MTIIIYRCNNHHNRDQDIRVNIEDVVRVSTCGKNRGRYEEAKLFARTAIGPSVNLKEKNSLHSLAVVSEMEGLVSGAKVCNRV